VISATKIMAGMNEMPINFIRWRRMPGEPITSQQASKAENQIKACTLKSGKVENSTASISNGSSNA
jgi:hypothetical protein